jgi:translation initiation factor 1
MSNSKLVFSTNAGRIKEDKNAGKKTSGPAQGPVKMRLEKNGRGGKQVTVLFNLPYTDDDARNLLKTLQGMLGTGGTYKDGAMEFRGDMRDRIEAYFTKSGLKIVRAGG